MADTAETVARLQDVRRELEELFFERKPLILAMLLGLLSAHHVHVHGPVGSGKSDAAREFARRLLGVRYFEALLSRQRPDAAVMGQWDLPLLMATGEFKRRNDGYLTTADIAFLDEIGKISPTLGHDLLGALNERVMHEVDEDGSYRRIPLHSAITASNEKLGGDDDVEALWDRLLIRVTVDYIQETGTLLKFLQSAVGEPGRPDPKATVPYADVLEVAALVPYTEVPNTVLSHMVKIQRKLAVQGVVVSDRRLFQSVRVVQAHTVLHGRTKATNADLAALDFTLWSELEQRALVTRARADVADPLQKRSLQLTDDLIGLQKEMEARRGKSVAERMGFGDEAATKLEQVEAELRVLAQKYPGGDTGALEAVRKQGERLSKLIAEIAYEQTNMFDEDLEAL